MFPQHSILISLLPVTDFNSLLNESRHRKPPIYNQISRLPCHCSVPFLLYGSAFSFRSQLAIGENRINPTVPRQNGTALVYLNLITPYHAAQKSQLAGSRQPGREKKANKDIISCFLVCVNKRLVLVTFSAGIMCASLFRQHDPGQMSNTRS